MNFLLYEKGLDFSDSEDMLGGSSSKISTAQVPKTSNLKSSIKVRSQSWLKLSTYTTRENSFSAGAYGHKILQDLSSRLEVHLSFLQ